MRLLTLDDVLHIARRTLGAVEIRDIGLLESAVARPATSVFGDDAYPLLHNKAAALVHSLARNHALVDGNKRLAFASLFAFLGLNGERVVLDEDDAYQLIVDIASGVLDDVAAIASVIDRGTALVSFGGRPE
ncbi:death-on-curing protein [Nocardioides sp. Root190]|uniref:type II toxin-antitoxin system death-on-curing family toxin n=1 Tax=Nocardioides sp. Root190 TaxID=1736488 RepID=UPI0006FEAD09|nr:type II toxin-antitoxin system death-on-curing family toxin [Nocardioides sp. Root190]KRB76969.1 death-on-curing protein [Nocardioides sp. Root190]